MAKSSTICIKVEPELKEHAEQILSKLGIPMSTAINIFLHQIVIRKGLPFDVSPQIEFINDIEVKE